MTAVAMRRPSRRSRSSPILSFLVRRIAGAILALLAASILIFLAVQVLPGNAATAVLGRNASPQTVSILEHQMHLDQPLPTRYAQWLGGFVHGDLGDCSVALAQGATHAPVSHLISGPLKNSLILASIT